MDGVEGGRDQSATVVLPHVLKVLCGSLPKRRVRCQHQRLRKALGQRLGDQLLDFFFRRKAELINTRGVLVGLIEREHRHGRGVLLRQSRHILLDQWTDKGGGPRTDQLGNGLLKRALCGVGKAQFRAVRTAVHGVGTEHAPLDGFSR